MKPNSSVSAVLMMVFALALCTSVRAGDDDRQVVEAGPEDGFLCCNGLVPFLFQGEKVLTSTGRAGVFRSEARGERWQRSMKNLVAPNGVSGFVAHLCQAPSDPRIVYALAGLGIGLVPFDGLFSSQDFGETWTRRAAVPGNFGFVNCAVDDRDPRTVYVTDFSQNWKSTDGGSSLQDFTVPACAAGGLVFPRHGVLYVSGGGGCNYVSTDGGLSFAVLAQPPASFDSLNISPDGRAIFISTYDASFSPTGTFRSIDGGASYVAVSGLPNGVSTGGLAFDRANTGRIYATDGQLYVSNDGGLTFVLLPASNDARFFAGVQAIYADRRGSLYLSTFGGPFRTDDGGRSFRSLLNGFRASSVNNLAFAADGKLLVGVNNTRGAFQQTQALKYGPIADALPRGSGGENTIVAIAGSPVDANVIVAATLAQGGVFRTEDGGHSWTPVSGTPSFFNSAARMAFPTSERAYLVTPAGVGPGLYRSDDAGRSFAHLSSLRFGTLAIHPANADVLYLGTYSRSNGLFKSIDGGQTLQSLGQPGFFSALAVDSYDTRVIYAGERFGQVIRSLDGGQTFAPASTGLAGAGVHGLAQDARGTLYAWLRGGGLFASHDRASSWQPVDTGEALQRSGVEAGRGTVVADPRRPGRVYLGNGGVIRIDTDGEHDD